MLQAADILKPDLMLPPVFLIMKKGRLGERIKLNDSVVGDGELNCFNVADRSRFGFPTNVRKRPVVAVVGNA